MKKYLIKIVPILTIFALIGCEGSIEIDPGFLIPEDVLETIPDIERTLLGTYDAQNFQTSNVNFNSRHSDEVRIGTGTRGQGLQTHAFQVVTDAGLPTTLYFSHYNVIDQINRVIERLDTFETPDEDQALSDQLRGEALGLRAYNYFDLLRAFAPSFDSNSPAVPLVTQVLRFGVDPPNVPRNTVGEVLTQINDDIASARALIPATLNDPNRFSVTAVNALEARIGLYLNTPVSLARSVDLATEVLTAVPLADATTYVNQFRMNSVDGEYIFQVDRDNQDQRIGQSFNDNNGAVGFAASVDFNAIIGTNDVRRGIIFDLENVITTGVANFGATANAIVGKYIGVLLKLISMLLEQ